MDQRVLTITLSKGLGQGPFTGAAQAPRPPLKQGVWSQSSSETPATLGFPEPQEA